MTAMQWILRSQAAFAKQPTAMPLLKPLAFLGRWSLSYYMLHQPVMLAGLWLWQKALGA
jgi:peptidoglycan/LPS O-acetylase OafA/YrhL